MAETLTNPYFDYVPEFGTNVWILREVEMRDIELIEGSYREMIWAKLYWSENQTGPWTFLTWIPYSFKDPTGY